MGSEHVNGTYITEPDCNREPFFSVGDQPFLFVKCDGSHHIRWYAGGHNSCYCSGWYLQDTANHATKYFNSSVPDEVLPKEDAFPQFPFPLSDWLTYTPGCGSAPQINL